MADFNEDGKADLAFADASLNSAGTRVFLGDGNGGFIAASGNPFPVGALVTSIATGDFNGDGHADLVVTNSADDSVTVLVGNGNGGFAQVAGSPFMAGRYPQSVAVGDFNGDGKADLVIANGAIDYSLIAGTVTVLLGNGAGSFTPAAGNPFVVGPESTAVVIADVNGDGKQDLVTTNAFNTNMITVMLGDGKGGFSPSPFPFAVGASPQFVAVGDFNGDGRADLAVANYDDGTLTVLLGLMPTGTSTVLSASPNPAVFGQPVVLTAMVSPPTATGLVTFYDGMRVLGYATVHSGTAVLSTIALAEGTRSLRGSYGGDTTDLASTSVNVPVTVRTNPTLTFNTSSGSPFPTGAFPWQIAMGDFNNDGIADLVVTNINSNNITVLLGNGSGGFMAAAGSPIAVGNSPRWVVVGDFNRDGNLDLAVSNADSKYITVLSGDGRGGFTPALAGCGKKSR